jgi:hypothetical protein
MKKILFLLLVTTASYSQALFDKGVKITGGITTDNNATKVVVQSANNVLNTIPKTELQDAFYFATASALPVVGITDKLYITRDDNKLYRFNGTIYVPLNAGITSTATNNFIPKVNAGGNLENSVITQNGTNIGINVTTPSRPLQVSGAATGTGHIVDVINTDTSVNLGFISGQAPNMANGQVFAISMGKMASNNNRASITYNHSSDGSTNNSIRFSFFGASNLFNIFANGRSTFGSTSDDGINRVQINGTVKASPAVTSDQLATLGQVNSSAILLTGNQTATGRKSFNSDNTTAGGITVSNNKTTGGAEAYGLAIFNTGSVGIYAENTTTGSTGDALRIANASNTGNGISVNNFGTGVGINLRKQESSTGDLLNAESGVTRIQSTGRLSTTLAPVSGNDVVNLTTIKSRDGWASYSTTTYTSGSPFTISPSSTVTLQNNANSSITADLPLGVSAFYNGTTNKITPAAIGDSYMVNIRFKAKTSSNNDYLTLFIDIGGGMQINAETKEFLRGANTEQSFNFALPVFSLSTFVTNGGEVKITSNLGTISVYDITYFITRTYTR